MTTKTALDYSVDGFEECRKRKNMVKDLQKNVVIKLTQKENGFTRVVIGPDVSKVSLERQLLELEKLLVQKVNCSNLNH